MAKQSRTDHSNALWAFWKPKGIINKENASALKAWLKKNADGVDIATFIHSAAHERKHAKAVSSLTK